MNSWRKKSVNRSIFVAMITVGSITVVVRLATVARELVAAYQFGTGDAMDAFLTAFLVPSFAVNIVAGSFNSALIPKFIHVHKNEGREAAQRLFSNVMIWSTCLLVAVSCLLAISAPYILPLIGSGYSSEKLALTRSVYYFLLPIIVISGLSTTWGAILNAGERFALAAVTPIVTPLFTVFFLLGFGKTWGVFAMAFGMLVGLWLELLVLGGALKLHGFYLLPRWHGMNDALKQVIKQYVPVVVGSFMMSSTVIVDQAMAAMLGPGSVASLNYGNKVVSLIVGIASLAIGTAVLPHFSQMAANDDWNGIKHTLITYIRFVVLTVIPITILLIFYSEPLVKLLYQRGAFTAQDTVLVSKTQTFLLVQLPFYISATLGVRLLSALAQNHVLMIISAINLVTNFIGNYVLMKFLGISGIALSTSIVYIISTLLIFYSLIMQFRKRGI
jgi:putative peptidoglycan lipid II flippase